MIILKLTLRLTDFSLWASLCERLPPHDSTYRWRKPNVAFTHLSSEKPCKDLFFFCGNRERNMQTWPRSPHAVLFLSSKLPCCCQIKIKLQRFVWTWLGWSSHGARSITAAISSLSSLIWSSIMIRVMLKYFSPSYEKGRKKKKHLSEFYGRHRKSLQLTELLPTHFHFNTILSLFKA